VAQGTTVALCPLYPSAHSGPVPTAPLCPCWPGPDLAVLRCCFDGFYEKDEFEK